MPDNNNIFGDTSIEQRRLAAYRHQAKLYVISNIDEIKEKYAKCIYLKLCTQNPDIKMHYGGEVNKSTGEREAKEIIKSYIILCEDCILLFNPNNMEPAVVEDVYIFTDYNITTFEHQLFLEYIQNQRSGENPLSEIAKKAAMRAGNAGGGYAMDKLGDLLVTRSNRLSSLAQHYDGGHNSRMRIERSFKGKAAQKEAFKKMFLQSKNFTKGATVGKMAGNFLKTKGTDMLKGSFRPISMVDALRPMDITHGSWDTPEKNRMKKIIPQELTIYCNKNNNYQWIVKQQYFTQNNNY